MIRIPNLLAGLLIGSELLAVLGVGFTVDTEARIRATIAAGETIAAAITSYTREHGQTPPRLDALVPRYLRSVPQAVFGTRAWEYEAASRRSTGDVGLFFEFEVHSAATVPDPRPTFFLAVRVDANHAEWHLRRRDDGCWQLPDTPRCW